ncbi:DNA independent RNA polymerase I transcription factor [Malassezia cuniculi]|uniref:DNA independent RNA polymerase I transcription factor n=1 Tax=Malassezia cuniculi TaxID=948313 RepID=A0AAF0ETK5_9BASI|nr:DNA independent RNA polymerase I transcription factor [Malassezia cuniculi]
MRSTPLAGAAGPPVRGTRQGMYIAFVKNAMLQKSQGELAPYNELVAQFQVGAQDAKPTSTAQLLAWLTALTHVATALDRTCATLVDAVLEYPWLALPDDAANAWVRFTCALVSARGEWVTKTAQLVFRNFGYQPEWFHGARGRIAEAPRPTRRQLYDRLHALLEALLRLVPTLPATLQPLLVQHFPHRRERTLAQVLYMRNLVRITTYCEALIEPVWTTIIDQALQIDVSIQVELDELEEQGIEQATIGLASALDRADGESDGAPSADVSPALAAHTPDDFDTLEDLSDDGYDDDMLTPAVQHDPAWGEVAAMAGRLDAMMKAMYDFLTEYVTGPDAQRYHLFQTLLGIFGRQVLPTFKSRHVQFILFWYSSLDPEFADMFLGTLLSKSLYVTRDTASTSADSAAIIRIAAASYVASYVARAHHVDGATTRMVLLNLCTFLDAGLESFSALGAAAPAPGAREHAVFYAVSQAVFYIFCFRWRDLRDVDGHEEDSMRSPAATYPNTGSFDLSPQLMPVLGAATSSYSSASSSGTSAMPRGSHGWAPGLSIVQRAITSPLNPLRYCNANVVQQFAYVAQHTGFQYCYSIIEANARRTKTSATTIAEEAPSTPQRSRLQSDVRESTPTPHKDDTPALLGATETLDAFFPFDPYRLRESSGFVERLYREWSDVAPEEEDDDEDAEGDDVSSSDDESRGGAERFTRFAARMRARAPHGATPESLAQSLEAMSISPFAV